MCVQIDYVAFEDCDFLGEVFSFELILYGKPKLTQWTKNVLTCALPKTLVSSV